MSDIDVNPAPEALPGVGGESKGLRTIARGGAINLVGSGVLLVATVIYQFAVARFLGPSQVGMFNLAVSVATMVQIVATFGLDKSLVRSIGGYAGMGDRAHEIGATRSAAMILLATSLLSTPVFWLASDFLAVTVFRKPDLAPTLRILAFCVPFLAVMQAALAVVMGYKRSEYYVVVQQVLLPLARISLVLLAVYLFGRSVTNVAYAFLVASLIAFYPAVFFAQKLYVQRRANVTPMPIYGELIAVALPFMLNALVLWTNNQTETLVLGGLAPASELGIYTTALKIAVFVTIFLNSLNIIFAPFVAELFAQGNLGRLAVQFRVVTRWAFSLALPVACGLFIFSPEVMALLGPGFAPGVWVLRLLVVGDLIIVLTGPTGLLLAMTRFQKLNVVNSLLSVALSLALDFALIPKYGAMGAAIAGSVMIVVLNLLRLVQVYLLLHMQPYDRRFVKPLIAGVASVIVALGFSWLLRDAWFLWRVILAGAALCVVYGALLWKMKLEKEDMEILEVVKQRLRTTGGGLFRR